MLEINFKILNELSNNSNASQRALAKIGEISLGKVNYLLKDFIEKGYINKITENNKFKYELTDLGRSVLDESIDKITETKISINEYSNEREVKQAVILAAGKQEEFDVPVGVLHIGNELIIERAIRILKKYGIEKIAIVTGFNNEKYRKLIDKYEDVYEVYNDGYFNSGTMQSLSLVNNIITDDFILIESDLVFEERAIEELINFSMRDCVLITTISGIGDEAFVEIRNNYLYKIGKDIHQFNKINGEFVGITKISKRLFELMLEEFKETENIMINYEYTLLDVARKYDIGYVNLESLKWGEVDNLLQYEKVKNNILNSIMQSDNR